MGHVCVCALVRACMSVCARVRVPYVCACNCVWTVWLEEFLYKHVNTSN